MKATNTLGEDLKAALSDFSDVKLFGRVPVQHFPLPDLSSNVELRGQRVNDIFRLPPTKSIFAPVVMEAYEEIIHGYVLSDRLRDTPLRGYIDQKFKWARFPLDHLCPTERVDETIVMLLWYAHKLFGGTLITGPNTVMLRRPGTDDWRGIDDGLICSRYPTGHAQMDLRTEILNVFHAGLPYPRRFRASPQAIEDHLMLRGGGPGLVQAWRLFTTFAGLNPRSVNVFLPPHLACTVIKGGKGAENLYRTEKANRLTGAAMRLFRKLNDTGCATHLDLRSAYNILVPAFCSSGEFQKEVGNPRHNYKDLKIITVRIKAALKTHVINKNPRLKGTL